MLLHLFVTPLPYNAVAARGLLGRTDKKHHLPFFGHRGGRLFL